jgi:predicted nucleic acid-binding protein
VIVLDASVLIAHLDANDAHHIRADELLESFSSEPLGASSITLAEVMVGPARAGRLDRAAATLRLLDVARVDLEDDAPMRLAMLRANTGLKLPDCCVLLAAERSGGVLSTFDDRLSAAAQAYGYIVIGNDPPARPIDGPTW